MRISRRVPIAVLVAASAALASALAVGGLSAVASDQGGDGKVLIKESLAPSLTSDPPFHGVNPGGAPWVLRAGRVQLSADGTLDLRVRGLVIPSPPADGTPGPVMTISASLFCGRDLDTAAVDRTEQVPISRAGDARIRDDSFNVPSTCLAPVILVHPNGNTAAYITVDGWRM